MNASWKREMSLLPYTGWRYDFIIVQRSNQFDQFSELGQHEKSRRGIWSMRFDMSSHSEGHSPGNTSRKREVPLLPYAGWR